jgi:polyhydroxybutyrate depolymerase
MRLAKGIAAAWAVFALSTGAARAAESCGVEAPCAVPNGEYLMRLPPGWDGATRLPVILYFSGAGIAAKDSWGDEGLRKAADSNHALIVFADGENRNWSYPGKMRGVRDDFKYADDVLDDVERRLPIDKGDILASGFSVGASMVWYLACLQASRFRAFAPVAGAFWEPMPTTCPAGPVSLRHVHGTSDRTVPMAGRELRGGLYKQGDVEESLRRLRARDGCADAPDKTYERGGLTCRLWSAKTCGSHREVEACLHQGAHMLDGEWVGDGFQWMKRLPRPD